MNIYAGKISIVAVLIISLVFGVLGEVLYRLAKGWENQKIPPKII